MSEIEFAYEIEVDYGVGGHTWEKGRLPAAQLARILRSEADRVESEAAVIEAERIRITDVNPRGDEPTGVVWSSLMAADGRVSGVSE